MRVFISADIEGIATTTIWPQANQGEYGYAEACQQMTREVRAACDGAIAAGADYILVKDAHATATNIDPAQLPECCEIIRGWSGHPYSMVTGVDKSFDAAMFIGYHSAAGRDGNPLSHTMSGDPLWIRINGRKVSEFLLYSWACALEGVPTLFLAGDRMLCDDYADLHPKLVTVPVKDGYGGMTRSLQPERACKLIRERSEQALLSDLSGALCRLPDDFLLEICYKDQKVATRRSFYPGCAKADDNTIRMHAGDYFEVLRAIGFLV